MKRPWYRARRTDRSRLPLPDLRQNVREVENTLSNLLGVAPAVDRVSWEVLADQSIPSTLSAGVPCKNAEQPSRHPVGRSRVDGRLRRDERGPFGVLSGASGRSRGPPDGPTRWAIWSSIRGKAIANAAGSLLIPIFNQGKNRAQLRIAKAQQQEALNAFQQSILSAGSEVSNALYQYKAAGDKKCFAQKSRSIRWSCR